MAFRGKEWQPPNPADVGDFIKDRMSLTELSMDSLKEVMSYAQFETLSAGDGTFPSLVSEAPAKTLALVNEAYYKNLKNFAGTIGPTETVNIVLPVYNSLHLVKECVDSVLRETHWPYHLTIVDDASDKYVNLELERIAAKHHKKITLLTNKKNRGFSATVNRGVKSYEEHSKYTCYLNSDVIVTPYWLTKMIVALNANPRNKIVNPVTNNTAVINVNMNPGYSFQAMNEVLEKSAARRYPEIMPTGFCFLFANSLIKQVGYLDEAYKNFGEETDFWMRTITWTDGKTYDRFRAVLADDTYVFHQRGASYATLGDEQHLNFRKLASGRFRQTWPNWGLWNKTIGTKAIDHIRKSHTTEELKETTTKALRPSVCFVTHSTEACGGMHYIADIVNRINAIGGDARVVQIQRENKQIGEAVGELRTAPIIFASVETFLLSFSRTVFEHGVVIAATSELAPHVAALCANNPKLTPVLHVQSYEPALVTDAEESKKFETNFSHIPKIISSSSWITKELEELPGFTGEILDTINPGVDRDIFYPTGRELGDDRPTVMVSINGQYPFKGAERGVLFAQALSTLAKKNHKELRILALHATAVEGASNILCQGNLPRTRVARLLASEVDLFVDPALNHSYGMPALEAISCGVPVIGWDNRGIREYLPKGYTESDVIVPNDVRPQKLAELAYQVIFTEGAMAKLAKHQSKVATIDAHDRKISVDRFIDVLQTNFSPNVDRKKIVVVTPHLRKHGGPTTILTLANGLAKQGHDVTVATVYSDLNPEVVKFTDLPIVLLEQDPTRIPACDLLITNSDNPLNASFSKLCPQAKKTIMLKLSHNPRFKELEEIGLNCPWDAIVTSTKWLADVCMNPEPGWNFKPVPATRIGWSHYNFESMRRNPKRKKIRALSAIDPIVVTTLIHGHPSKGSMDAGHIFAALKKAHGDKVKLYGVGEIPVADVKLQIPGMEYIYHPSRDEMAELLFKTDIWVGCSHGEGLGRMALEAMTGLAACVLTDTKAEYVVDGVNALVAPIGGLNVLANHINNLAMDPELRRSIAQAGFQTAKAMSDPTDMIEKLEEVIANVFKL